MPDDSQRISDLLEYLAREGVHMDRIAIDMFPCGTSTIRGLRATRDISEGDELLRIPYKLFLNADNALKHMPELEAAILAADATLQSTEEAENLRPSECTQGPSLILKSEFVMSCYLVKAFFDPLELKKSPFIRMLELLPTLEELPMLDFWYLTEFKSGPLSAEFNANTSIDDAAVSEKKQVLTREQMVALLGSKARFMKLSRRVTRLHTRFTQLQKRYFSASPSFFIPALFTFQNWLWASAIVNSRSFTYTRPTFTDYPKRYMQKKSESSSEDEETDDDDEEDEEGSEAGSSNSDDLVRACQEAVEHAKAAAALEKPRIAAVAKLRASSSRQRSKRTIGDADSDDEAGAAEALGRGVSDAIMYNRIPTEEEDAQDDASKDIYTLLPFADMFNHDETGAHDFALDEKTQCFVIKSDKRYLQDDQIFIRYNNMDHWRFAKYYGFVPEAPEKSATDKSKCGRNDGYPIVAPMPPHRLASQPGTSVLEVTKTLLFEDPILRKHCYVTSKGPNQSLLSALRLIHLNENDFEKYTFAFQKEMISVKNEWHAYKYLTSAISAALTEVKQYRSALNSVHGIAVGMSERSSVVHRCRERDFSVLSAAHKVSQLAFSNLSELLYYGTTTESIIRSNILHNQFVRLRSMGKIPKTAAEQSEAALGLIKHKAEPNRVPSVTPCATLINAVANPFRMDQYSIHDYVEVVQQRLAVKVRQIHSNTGMPPSGLIE